jgi:hypothetical protein
MLSHAGPRAIRVGLGCFFIVAVLAACGGSAATHSPGSTAAPIVQIVTPTPTPLPDFVHQVAGACHGFAVKEAVPYGGSLHPVYVVSGDSVQRADQQRSSFDSDEDQLTWLRAEWSSPLQLVVCIGSAAQVEVDSCGDYADPFGQAFEVIRYRQVRGVTVVEAATGRTIRQDVVLGSDPALCTQNADSHSLVGGEPDVYAFARAEATA